MKIKKVRANRKFSDEEVRAIRAERSAGMTYEALAIKWDCSIAAVMDIVKAKTYRWVQ